MKHRIVRPIRAAILAATPLALIAALLAATPGYADRTAELGIEDGAITLNPALQGQAPGVVSRWRNQLGADWVRIQAYWNAVSPQPRSTRKPSGFTVSNPNDTRYNWADLDRAVNLAQQNRLKVMLTVHQFGPVWASTQPSKHRQGWKPNPKVYAQFATAVARRYGNRVNRYLIGNEPNEGVFLGPQTECKRQGRKRVCERSAANIYRDLVNAAYPAIKRADPGAQVIIGELAPIGAIGKTAGNLAPLAFIRAMWCRDDHNKRIRTGACKRFRAPTGDAFGYHPYQVRERPNQPNRNPNVAKLGDLQRFFKTLDTASHRRFNLYITEYGYETSPPDRKNGVTPSTQARYLQESAYIVWATPRVKLVTQYLWQDDPFSSAGHVQGFQTGLNFANGKAKPSLASFPHPFFIDTSKGRDRAVVWGQVRPDGVRSATVQKQVGGQFRTLFTIGLDGRGYFSRRMSLPANSNYRFTYVLNGQTFTSDIAHVR